MAASRPRALSRYWRDDEEMAKKDDDRKLGAHARHQGQWQTARPPRRKLIARLAAYAGGAILLLFVLSKALGFGSEPYPRQYSEPLANHNPAVQQAPDTVVAAQDTAPAPAPQAPGADLRTYDAAVKFPWLAASIHSIAETNGGQQMNRNVLFATANLRSAAELLPMACQMAKERESYVHFAFIARSEIPMKDLLEINGIDRSCNIIFHDARPDFSLVSTETRMALSTARALYHINVNMHPQAIMIDSTDMEENYFLRGMRDGIRSTRSALIELPAKPSTRLAWITKLDSASLSAWNKVHYDILVYATPNGSGNLQRLLKSLARADIGGVAPPHITIELPNTIEKPTGSLLSAFQWPPASAGSTNPTNMLSLRHRISRHKMTEEESSVRFLESFWPAQPSTSHVLVLSPHTEITPQFFHYVKYVMLRYGYSRLAAMQDFHTRLMSISFSTPSTLLDSSQPLPPLTPEDETSTGSETPSFLWEAPTSNAVLFPGDKWIELHGYVSQLLEKSALLSASPAMISKKEISKNYPSWLESVLQLSRLRGYFTLYPGRETADAIVGVHTELNDKPQEYQDTEDDSESAQDGIRGQPSETFDYGSQTDMLKTLPNGGVLPLLTNLPLLSWNGKEVDLEDLEKEAVNYRQKFRLEVGQCSEMEDKKADQYARDLFCKNTEAKA